MTTRLQNTEDALAKVKWERDKLVARLADKATPEDWKEVIVIQAAIKALEEIYDSEKDHHDD